MSAMRPYEHIERAEVLVRVADKNWDTEGRWIGERFGDHPSPELTLAGLHLQLAHMKMLGRQRVA